MKPPIKPFNSHPACLAFPLLANAELRELAEDIKLRGVLQPVVVYRGQVLDGRNRLAACEMAGVAPHFTEWQGGSPVKFPPPAQQAPEGTRPTAAALRFPRCRS